MQMIAGENKPLDYIYHHLWCVRRRPLMCPENLEEQDVWFNFDPLSHGFCQIGNLARH